MNVEKLIDAKMLMKTIQDRYIPTDTISAGTLWDLIATAAPVCPTQLYGLTPSEVADLAQAKKDGRMVVLPCKVGDTVWEIPPYGRKKRVVERHIESIEVCHGNKFMLIFGTVTWAMAGEIGKTVFLTREEAKAALKGESQK